MTSKILLIKKYPITSVFKYDLRNSSTVAGNFPASRLEFSFLLLYSCGFLWAGVFKAEYLANSNQHRLLYIVASDYYISNRLLKQHQTTKVASQTTPNPNYGGQNQNVINSQCLN